MMKLPNITANKATAFAFLVFAALGSSMANFSMTSSSSRGSRADGFGCDGGGCRVPPSLAAFGTHQPSATNAQQHLLQQTQQVKESRPNMMTHLSLEDATGASSGQEGNNAFGGANTPTRRLKHLEYEKFERAHRELGEEEGEDDKSSPTKPWGEAIGVSLMISSVTLVGVIVTYGLTAFAVSGKARDCLLNLIFPSFAVGTLLATTLFLIVPESLEYIEGNSESEVTYKFGCSVLGGFVLVQLLENALSRRYADASEDKSNGSNVKTDSVSSEIVSVANGAPNNKETVSDSDAWSSRSKPTFDDDDDVETGHSKEPKKKVIDWTFATSLLVGDFFHNFVDGVFLGNAFLFCDRTLVWLILASTISHEFSQEVCDFVLLTHYCGFSTVQALALNFLSGLSVVLGCLIVMASELDHSSIGILLGLSAGVYIAVAAAEVQPRINDQAIHGIKDGLLSLLFFTIGAVIIGLVLLDHRHCSEEGGNDGDHHH